MDNENKVLQEDIQQDAQPCAKCAEYKENEEALEIGLVILAFIGPIIGILIGLFAAKKLLSRGA